MSDLGDRIAFYTRRSQMMQREVEAGLLSPYDRELAECRRALRDLMDIDGDDPQDATDGHRAVNATEGGTQ